MNRRAFLALSAVSPLTHLLPAFADSPSVMRELKADVAILGGGVGGVAAALAAARGGASVILTEEFDWIGGQLTSQAVPPDEHPWIEDRGCTRLYRQFRDGVRGYYAKHYPLTDSAKKAKHLNPGNGSVSKLCHEPRVAAAVLLEMLAPYISRGSVRLLQPHRVVGADLTGDRLKAVAVKNLRTGQRIAIQASYFLDATELGDLLPLAKAEFVTGAEAKKETAEPSAKEKAEPDNHQAFTCCFAVSHHPGEDHTLPKPADYDFWAKYVPKMTPAWPGKLLSWEMSQYNEPTKVRKVGFDPARPTEKGVLNLWTYRRIVDRANFADDQFADVCLVNWPQNDYWLGNLIGPDADKHLAGGKQLSLSLLYWMQTAAPRADGKLGWPGLKLRPDIVGTDDGLAMAPYVRESRRIVAEFTVLEQHVGTTARELATGKKRGEITAEAFPDTVGIGSYRIDLHPSSGGDNYIDVSSLPFQIPLGCLIPKRVENLLAAGKCAGTTHITNGAFRLHPVEWNIGEAAGALAAWCLKQKVAPKGVRADAKKLKAFQDQLKNDGVELEWPAELATKFR
ncbi:MAG: FAD-dependent oxidoreductase [Fimbriiglobus sp.]|nr:FAD-dependent oxidoreductase [Fimbriiglobus sp.]